ncbi:hypothetical protein NG798_00650 [Ancylothrix sp. C2]|uniref:hypothetical protein n=1 Tax=Ancylothrix sp. D3o TaxID=2953691 RepID=UPI0021BA8714|nr:hypothetical protein [Ancylothrix sp. D3o]MCT7948302.1 hypothetical protein [Ancylothrix sp. D3o]
MAVDRALPEFFGDRATQDPETGAITFYPQDLTSNATPPRWPALVGVGPHTAESVMLSLVLRTGERQDTSNDSQLAIAGPDISLSSRSVDGVMKTAMVYLFQMQVVNVFEAMMPNPSLI